MIKLKNLIETIWRARYKRPDGTPMDDFWDMHDDIKSSVLGNYAFMTAGSLTKQLNILQNGIEELRKEDITKYTDSKDRRAISKSLTSAVTVLKRAKQKINERKLSDALAWIDNALNHFHTAIDLLADLYVRNYRE